MDRLEFAEHALMRSVGVSRRGARRALVTVMIAESGHEHNDGFDGAKANPLNTTLVTPGSTPLEGNTAGVQNYPTVGAGIAATATTLSGTNYVELRKVLSRRFVSTQAVLRAWAASPWGPQDFSALNEVLLTTYRPNKRFWNRLPVG